MKRIVLGSLTCALLGVAAWLFRPYSAPDRSLIEPRLLALREPFRSVTAVRFLDGGSVGIAISDADGREERFALPAHLGSPERYERVFVGAVYDARPGATPVSRPLATKQALILVLARYSHGQAEADVVRFTLTRRLRDLFPVLLHSLRGHYSHPSAA